jgi:hypothetical protein
MASPPISTSDIFTGQEPYIRDMGWAYNPDTLSIESGEFIMDVLAIRDYAGNITETVKWSLADSNESSDYIGTAIFDDMLKRCNYEDASHNVRFSIMVDGPPVVHDGLYPMGKCDMIVPIYFKSTKVFHYIENGSVVLDVPSNFGLIDYKLYGRANFSINPVLVLAINDVYSIAVEQHFENVYVRVNCRVTISGDIPVFNGIDNYSYKDDGEDWIFPSGKYRFAPITATEYIHVSYNYIEPANATAVGFTVPSVTVLAEDILSIVNDVDTILMDVAKLKKFSFLMAKAMRKNTRNTSGITEYLSSKIVGEIYWTSDDSLFVLSRFLARSSDAVLKLFGTKIFSLISDAVFANADNLINDNRSSEILNSYEDQLLDSIYQSWTFLGEKRLGDGGLMETEDIISAATEFLTLIKNIKTWSYSRSWTEELSNNFIPMVYLVSTQIIALGDFSKFFGKILAPLDPVTAGRLRRLPRHAYTVVIFPFFDSVWKRNIYIFSFGNLEQDTVKQLLGLASSWENYRSTQTWNDNTGEWEGEDLKDKLNSDGSILLASDHCVVTREQIDNWSNLLVEHSGNYNLFYNNCRHIAIQFFDYFARRIVPTYLPFTEGV